MKTTVTGSRAAGTRWRSVPREVRRLSPPDHDRPSHLAARPPAADRGLVRLRSRSRRVHVRHRMARRPTGVRKRGHMTFTEQLDTMLARLKEQDEKNHDLEHDLPHVHTADNGMDPDP